MDSPVLEIASRWAEKKTESPCCTTAPARSPTSSCTRWSRRSHRSRPRTASSRDLGVLSTERSSITASREHRHSDPSEGNQGGRKVSSLAASWTGPGQSSVWDSFPSEVCPDVARAARPHCRPAGTVWRRRRSVGRGRRRARLPSPREISSPRYRQSLVLVSLMFWLNMLPIIIFWLGSD